MSGHMVGVDIANGKLFYLAHIADEEQACNAVMQATGEANATALAPVPNAVFAFLDIPEGKIAPYHPG